MESTTLFDSFNARYLSFQEVADSFIPNEYFFQLFENNHSLLMGPRGCGKTTLLKMLTPACLALWDQKNSSYYLDKIPFYGIYIPTDIQWKRQLDAVQKDISDENFSQTISKSTVTINILLSTARVFSFLIRHYSGEQTTEEVEFCKSLIDHWLLMKPLAPTLNAIETDLLLKTRDINIQLRKKQVDKDYQLELSSFHYADFFDLLRISFDTFQNMFPKIPTKRWALCFDELEIAPSWLQFELVTSFRSREQSILFKLTTAPFLSLKKAISSNTEAINSSNLNDYNAVKIWTSSQKEFKGWYDFSKRVFQSRVSRRYGFKVTAEEVFGHSHWERLIVQSIGGVKHDLDRADFVEGSPTWHIMRELAVIDESFRQFLIKKKINPLDPKPSHKNQKDEIFRKIKQIVVYRFQFKKSGRYKRSRKVVPLYFGVPLIFEFCDGNPRILNALIDEFLDNAFSHQINTFREISINEQSRVLTSMSTQYLSVIAAHPDANVTINNENFNLKYLLELIGDYFHSKMVESEFTMDPIGSFRVDEDINIKIVELLQLATFLGAIVCMDRQLDLNESLIGKRFRLCYTLSPYFSLLSRDYPAINLSTILPKAAISNNPRLF
jgi:energy-coupling factor transporter ATP-binding protein EcfA2